MTKTKIHAPPNQWVAAGHSESGGRPYNEDSYGVLPSRPTNSSVISVAIVADGVGGENAGEWASRTAVELVMRYINAHAPEFSISELLHRALNETNREMMRQLGVHPHRDGASTTIVIAAIEGDRLYLCHLGDSRAYLVRNGRAHQMTLDHSVVQEEYDAGLISSQQMIEHPELHTITRFLGDATSIEPDLDILDPYQEKAVYKQPGERKILRSLDLFPDDIVVLCSDGLTDVVPDEDIARIAARHNTAKQKAQALVRYAVNQHTPDNVTAVALLKTSASESRSSIWRTGAFIVFMLLLVGGAIVGAYFVNNGSSPGQDRSDMSSTPLAVTENTLDKVNTISPANVTIAKSTEPPKRTPLLPTVTTALATQAATPTLTPTATPTVTPTLTQGVEIAPILPTETISTSSPPTNASQKTPSEGEAIRQTTTPIAQFPAPALSGDITQTTSLTSTTAFENVPISLTVTLESPEDEGTINVRTRFSWTPAGRLLDEEVYNVIICVQVEQASPQDFGRCAKKNDILEKGVTISEGTQDTEIESKLTDLIEKHELPPGNYWWAVVRLKKGQKAPINLLSETRTFVLSPP